jgi:hypothetical protein
VFTRARQAAILVMLAGMLGANRIAAGEGRCSSLAVDADADLGARWPDLPERIRGALAGRRDVDLCARVALGLGPKGIVVAVVLPDGRSASRSVSRPEDVVPTLEALVLLPRAEAGAPDVHKIGAAKPAGDGARVIAASSAPIVSTRAPAANDAGFGPGRLRLEFSLLTGARAGDGAAGVTFGALTLFDIAGWLLGFEASASGYQGAAPGPGASALAAAVVGGRGSGGAVSRST